MQRSARSIAAPGASRRYSGAKERRFHDPDIEPRQPPLTMNMMRDNDFRPEACQPLALGLPVLTP